MFIRMGKARIRRGILDSKKQGELIEGLYKKFTNKNNDNKGNI